ncbi:uncharacterized protein EV422DRAFT_503877 [Fimicolochytrium jonesii]|uniref:uncharacterized protein n=1 Tax=Fimicolochytrium jonesii TaxID=1396493 RepID=UPI0022FDFF0D|nr:uncharacterized protein EV422DRAFT_503877 [Fimicolochytrium jonesii]KAI8825117.1 hypothetical protein EV422DRAFT_503877 [Fimicolochytrium jonesii]
MSLGQCFPPAPRFVRRTCSADLSRRSFGSDFEPRRSVDSGPVYVQPRSSTDLGRRPHARPRRAQSSQPIVWSVSATPLPSPPLSNNHSLDVPPTYDVAMSDSDGSSMRSSSEVSVRAAPMPDLPVPSTLPQSPDVPPPAYPRTSRPSTSAGQRAFNSPPDATCLVRIPGAGDFFIHRDYVSPYSTTLRDLLDPLYRPTQRTLRIRAGPEVVYWVREGEYTALSPPRMSANSPRTAAGFSTEPGTALKRHRSFSDLFTSASRWSQSLLSRRSSTASIPAADETARIEQIIGGPATANSFDTYTTKSAFWAHVKLHKSTHSGRRNSLSPSRLRKAVPRPILYIDIPCAAVFGPLLHWLYTGSQRDLIDALTAGGAESAFFDFLKCIEQLGIVDEVYEAIGEYLIKNPHLTVTHEFCKRNVPFQLLRTFFARCDWGNTDKLAVLLWWSRFEEEENDYFLPTSSPSLADAMATPTPSMRALLRNASAFLTRPATADPEMELLALYVDLMEVPDVHIEELRRMLPLAYDRVVGGGGRRAMSPTRHPRGGVDGST